MFSALWVFSGKNSWRINEYYLDFFPFHLLRLFLIDRNVVSTESPFWRKHWLATDYGIWIWMHIKESGKLWNIYNSQSLTRCYKMSLKSTEFAISSSSMQDLEPYFWTRQCHKSKLIFRMKQTIATSLDRVSSFLLLLKILFLH